MAFKDRQPRIGHTTTSGMDMLTHDDLGAYADARKAREEADLAQPTDLQTAEVPAQRRNSATRRLSVTTLKGLVLRPSNGRHVASRS